ncbi:hypothetical protein [Deinococcus hopiensis]|uniref:Uncharacterized protein n=1 Tax=Deinococcus hopiensis KR-140 TaxID=695939 RepID=A0A1W1UNC9_9DEIO|nr:hypothetical protein [Deinococcus hopiensis]SMB82523.1 hypothetical protein SAMN00790413_04048 [Deinococcus hopiensis KR-140]
MNVKRLTRKYLWRLKRSDTPVMAGLAFGVVALTLLIMQLLMR